MACARVIGVRLDCKHILKFGASLESSHVLGLAPVPVSDLFHLVALVVFSFTSLFAPPPISVMFKGPVGVKKVSSGRRAFMFALSPPPPRFQCCTTIECSGVAKKIPSMREARRPRARNIEIGGQGGREGARV